MRPDLYRCRRQIELFFKWIKQHLRIKSFFGTSEITALTLNVVAVSIVLHGRSVTPLMNLYARRAAHRRPG